MSRALQFPDYVPPSARNFFATEIANLTAGIRWYDDQIAISRNKLTQEEERNFRVLLNRMALVKRLADVEDKLMQRTYELLQGEFTNSKLYARYFAAAYYAMRDYGEYKKLKIEGRELLENIGRLANDLAGAISRLQRTGLHLPPELRPRAEGSTYSLSFATIYQLLETASDDRSMPDAVSLLRNIAAVVRVHPITFDAFIESAIARRSSNTKTNYLRAFEELLTSCNRNIFEPFVRLELFSLYKQSFGWYGKIEEPITITLGVRKAMAETSTVALSIELPNVVVFPGDVSRALGRSTAHKKALTVRKRRVD